ncbi:putative E3 ubiquitin-protein ligase LIN-1 isoform X4 [Manihot esculenta]|uniref:putative E3 ubiquitin-protein ligase LIN-1 isoform X4 n=1 Tax=Manihot esculenta TaxID=3983 RepID=UPI001CC44450|nr:putative E3 ubiquitin-protein ligase LIN-1 isoform X4 [Manihot esculenta]
MALRGREILLSEEMASSLEDLLAEEGFRGRRSGMTSRASFRAEAVIKSLHPKRDKSKADSPSSLLSHRIKTERTRSDVSRYILRGELTSDSSSRRRPTDNLVSREKIDGKSRTETWERLGHRVSTDIQNNKTRNSEDIEDSEITEIGIEEDERVKDIYSDKAYNSERSEKSSERNREKQTYIERKGSSIKIDQTVSSNSNENVLKCTSLRDSNKKSMRQPDPSHDSSIRSSKNAKNFEVDHGSKREDLSLQFSKLAFDEVAVRATVSILNGYIKRFLKDEEFRCMLRHNCFSSLSFTENGEGHKIESKVINNLEQAIEIVEKAAEEAASTKDLKKASLQLCMITSLNSNAMKDGYTSGTPYSRLSACAHLYLSVIYKLQKKDRVSAKYLLQVFCDSPFPARTLLLTELWDYLFSPHLSHLKGWYNQEADSLLNTPGKMTKLKLLDKVYNEILDSSTYQFAVYYKDWLTEGVEAPSLPSIHIPSMSVQEDQQTDSQDHSSGPSTSSDFFSPQPMDHGLLSASNEDWKLIKVNASPETDINSDRSNANGQQEPAGDGHMPNTFSHTEANELILKNLAKSVFELPQTEDSGDLTVSAFSHTSEPINVSASYEELYGTYEYFSKGSFFASIPQDFICPLSGKLFEEPVTLETGQTFEKEVIREWFNQGNRTCPGTKKALECLTVPCTNFILKRIIDSWKLEYCSHLLALASQIIRNSEKHESRQWNETAFLILEKLLTTFGREERLANAKHLISLGGLDFPIRQFTLGNLEEKMRMIPLLSCYIEADGSCRNQIARKIDRQSLFDLLHSKQTNSRRNTVFLMTELCLSRRKDVKLFLSGWQNEEIMHTMHILLMYLQNSPPEQRPWVAVLLLHLDLLLLQVEPQKYSIYRDEAVDAIAGSLEDSLTDGKILKKSCTALLALGGRFSSSGKSLTESWMLKQAGFNDNYETNSKEDNLSLNEPFLLEDEETVDEWLRNLSTCLLGSGKKSFLEAISKCLASGNLELVKACLTTIACLSCSLPALSDAELHLSAFSALLSSLKESLENGRRIEHKVLASISLLNFSKIPECRVLLMTIAEEIAVPLGSLVEVTWTAKQLYAIISGECL